MTRAHHLRLGVAVAALGILGARTARAQVPAELRGHITDARTAQPIAEARVEVVGRPEMARSGTDGAYVLRGLEPRAYTVSIRALGYGVQQFDVQIENGRSTLLDVALDPVATALGAVVVRDARAVTDTQSVNAVVFDRAAIESSDRRDVGELLQTTPGVVITQAGGPGSATHVSIRGSGANEVLVLVDGVPVNSALSGDVDLSQIPLETVERVTVRTGAQSARYGGRALAGVVEITTRRPAHDASLLTRAGAWGERNVAASVGDTRPLGKTVAGASLTTDYRTVRGDFPYDIPAERGGGTADRINSDVTSRQVLGTSSLDGSDWSAALRGSWESLSRGLAGSIVQPSATGREGQSRATAGIDAHGDRGVLSWMANGNATREQGTYADSAPPFGSPYGDTVRANELTSSASATLSGHAASAELGGEARSLDIHSTSLAEGSPHWQRLLGAWATLRGSHLVDAAATRIDGELGARVDGNSLDAGTTLSPRGALSLTRGIVVLSGSLGAGYAPPTLSDQFFHEGVQVQPNPNLRPERTRDDLDGRLAIRETDVGPFRLSGEAAAYRANVDGMILWLPNFRFVWSPANYDVHRSGWELNGRGALPATGLDLQGTLNRADVVYAGPVLTGQVAYRPRTTGSVTAGFSSRIGRLELTDEYVGDRRTVPGSPLNTLDPYWLTNAKLTSSLVRRAWRVDGTLGVDNIFDRPAAMLVDYPFPGRTWSVSLRLRRGEMSEQ